MDIVLAAASLRERASRKVVIVKIGDQEVRLINALWRGAREFLLVTNDEIKAIDPYTAIDLFDRTKRESIST